jgi:hypothetical protein
VLRTTNPQLSLSVTSLRGGLLAGILIAAAAAQPLHSQTPDALAPEPSAARVVMIGSAEEDRERVSQLLGQRGTAGFLARTPSLRGAAARTEGTPPRWRLLLPELRTVWNSDIPFSLNEGALWAGRGANLMLSGGVQLELGPASLRLLPQVAHQQNRHVPLTSPPGRHWSIFAAPWHTGEQSADLPLRFGSQPFTTFDWGQSRLSLAGRAWEAGISTENLWWGPGIRNALVMSNNAPGVPHAFVGSQAPLRTRIGSFEGRWMLGGLSPSLYFDTLQAGGRRSLSGAVVTFAPAVDRDLTLGAARTVIAPLDGWDEAPARLLDVFTRSGRPRRDAAGAWQSGPDQLTSLFARLVLPDQGAEVYAEWARRELPTSFRDWLVAPHHSQGYTLGAQWVGPLPRAALLRVQGEVSYLEQSPTFRHRRIDSFYTSRSVAHGYTQRGQVIGAAIGPGASSQWLAVDYLAEGWHLGVGGGRIRWENDAYYRQPTGVGFLAHDVTVHASLRGGMRLPWGTVAADYTAGKRYNYLFLNPSRFFEPEGAVDIVNHTLRVTLTPGRR